MLVGKVSHNFLPLYDAHYPKAQPAARFVRSPLPQHMCYVEMYVDVGARIYLELFQFTSQIVGDDDKLNCGSVIESCL